MKKSLYALMLLMGIVAVSHAGTPQDQPLPGQNPFSNSTIVGSTSSVRSDANLTVTLAPGTVWNGASVSCRNCFTKFVVQVTTTAVLNVLDGGTTVQYIFGTGLGTTGTNTIALPEDHLGPLCLTAGNSTTFNLVNTNGSSVWPEAFNYEGFIACGTPNSGGAMK